MAQSVHDTLESVPPDDEPASVQQQQQRQGSHSTSRDGQSETGTNPVAAIFVPIATQEAASRTCSWEPVMGEITILKSMICALTRTVVKLSSEFISHQATTSNELKVKVRDCDQLRQQVSALRCENVALLSDANKAK